MLKSLLPRVVSSFSLCSFNSAEEEQAEEDEVVSEEVLEVPGRGWLFFSDSREQLAHGHGMVTSPLAHRGTDSSAMAAGFRIQLSVLPRQFPQP